MAGGTNNDDEFFAELNLTPLIDVMLVLIIIFMATSSVAIDKAIKVSLPEQKAIESQVSKQALKIAINGKKEIYFKKKKLNMKQLESLFKENAKTKKAVVLYGDKTIPLELIVKVLDMSKKSGIPGFALATQ